MHTYIQCQNQQVNHRHIKITYLLTAPKPARGSYDMWHNAENNFAIYHQQGHAIAEFLHFRGKRLHGCCDASHL